MSEPQIPLAAESLQTPYPQLNPAQKQQRLRELAWVFLQLGTIAFGGPAAHIAMMDDVVVKQRQWLSRERLLDLLGVANLIPGPNSTELAIYIGYERAGWQGLVIAGTCFILPAMLIVWALAAVYVRFQTIPAVGWLLYGVKPVIIAIVLQAVWKLGKTAIKNMPTAIAGAAVIVAFCLHVNAIVLLLVAGLGVMLSQSRGQGRTTGAAALLPIPSLLVQVSVATATGKATWLQVLLVFLKIGAVLYGSGYVLLAFLQRDLVEQTHWLTSQQLLDAVAIGQITPGPVFTTATFIGYLLAGNAGAITGTIGIFLPAFVLIAIVNPWVPRLRSSPWTSGFLDGVNAAALGLMAVVAYTLARGTLLDWLTSVVALASAIIGFRFQINSAWLVLAGGVIGFLAQQLGWLS